MRPTRIATSGAPRAGTVTSGPRRLARAFVLLLAANVAHAAGGDTTVVMKADSEPGEAGEMLVFVGEQVGYEPLDMSCGEDCWTFDDWHKARYRVAEWIHGVPPGPEIDFSVAEHSVTEPFGHSRYALVFVERTGDSFSLVKYQQVPVYPTADGSFASCGPYDDGETGAPPLVDVEFAPALVVDDVGRRSAFGSADPAAVLRDDDGQYDPERGGVYDPRWHGRAGGLIECRRGVRVEALVPYMVREHATLAAALPDLAGGR